MPEEQETGFTFVDKRGAAEPGSEAQQDEEASQESGVSPAQPAGSPFQLPQLDATDRIAFSINWLSEGAWVALGLVRDPATERIEQDLPGARRLIDCIAYLVSQAEPGVGEETRRELRTLVRDLQLNFVQQQKRAQ